MHICFKLPFFPCFLGVSGLILVSCTPQNRAFNAQKTNHFAMPASYNSAYYGGYAQPMPNNLSPYQARKIEKARLKAVRKADKSRQAQARRFPSAPNRHPYARPPVPQFQQWVDYEPQYMLYPGDQIDIVVSSAPELSRTLTVGPDGRVVMPMTEPVMAAGRSFTQLQNALQQQLSQQLRDPRITVTPRAYGPQQIFVGGEVTAQGTYTLPGPIGVLEAVYMAGGFLNTAKTGKVVVLRRAPNGGMMMRTVNIDRGLNAIGLYGDIIQLRRGDIIYVPKTSLAEVGVFVQNLRSALPFDFNVSYTFGDNGDNGITTVIQ